ncbi:MAG: hypothetical protein JWO03_624 [Bacteroidetes bacterium]|nr:hypothetical protein [Bacteroidota bacterium]
MKKQILQLIVFMALVLSGKAQTTVPNGEFENWQNVSTVTEEPTNWNSNRTGGGFATSGPQTCFRDVSTLNGGSYCMKIQTGSFFTVVVNGSGTTGKVEAPSTNKSEGYIHTIAGDPNYSSPFTGRPDSISFWYKYTKQGSDYPKIETRLHVSNAYAPEAPVNSNHPNATANIVARALWDGPAANQSTWTRISVPFVYVDGRTPEYILVTMTSSGDQNGGTSGSILWVDGMTAIYNPTLTTSTSVSTGPYYVSAAQGASISVPFTMTGTFAGGNTVTAQLSDASGSFASPVTIGSVVATASGTVSATIPAGTATGTGYRVRVVSSSPAITAADNGSNITIDLVSNSIAPTTTQTIAVNTNGTTLNVTETPAAASREWKYATVSGGPYQSFPVAQTGSSYIPNSPVAGTFYVVCVSAYAGGLAITSNEVIINVVSNSIAPTTSQSLLTGVSGNMLTVTETPTGASREWKYATTSGGSYSSFTTAQTGTTYTPVFNTSGTYYVVCQSVISGVTVTSNEVIVSVGNATITTSSITGSPFLFSPSAPDASVSVGYTTSGTFNGGNIFTAQLSDASGSFAAATSIGTITATSGGTISATLPHTTPAGTGYRIRVISSNPALLGSDNGSNLTVDQFNNSIAPTTMQMIAINTAGTAVAVTASQTSTQVWEYSTTSGSGYTQFAPAETGSSYTPQFALPGTYYVVAKSINQYNDTALSGEVMIMVSNGTTLTTSAVAGSPFLTSPKANVQVTVNYTSNVVYSNGNVFTAQISDATGDFTNAVNIGQVTATTVTPISAQIPNTSVAGTGYRIRVISSSPALTGTDNGTNLEVIPFQISISSLATQNIYTHIDGAPVTITATHPAIYEWKYNGVLSTTNFHSFTPKDTDNVYVPHFDVPAVYYVNCTAVNSWMDSITTVYFVINVTDTTVGIHELSQSGAKLYWMGSNLITDMTQADITGATLELMNLSGQAILSTPLREKDMNITQADLSAGVYIFRIVSAQGAMTGKIIKQ